MHLVGQLLDQVGEVGGGQLRQPRTGAGLAARAHPRHRRLASGLLAARAPEQLGGVGVLAVDQVGDVGDLLAQRHRVDTALGVVRHLLGPAPVRLVDRLRHRRRDLVGVHVHLARHVAGGSTDGLDQRGSRTQEALLVGVQDRHQRHLGQVQALAQQVDADQDVELADPQLAQQLDAAKGVDLGVQVAHPHTLLEQVVGEVLGHLLGQRRHQHPLVAGGPLADLVQEVVDLSLGRFDDDLGVDQPGGPDDLLDDAVALGQLVRAGSGREVDGLPDAGEELLPPQRAVVHRAGQAEPVVDQRALARHVAFEHRPDLWHRDVRLVDDQEEVLGEVVQQGVGRGARPTAVDVSAVVLDAGARPDLAHHLDVVRRAHPQPLGLEQLALALELLQPLLELGLDRADRPLHALGACDVVGRREDVHLLFLVHDLTGQRVQGVDPLDLVPEELDPDRELFVDRDDLDRVAAHPERAAGEGEVVAGVLHADEPAQQVVALDPVTDLQPGHPVDVLLRGAEAVDA